MRQKVREKIFSFFCWPFVSFPNCSCLIFLVSFLYPSCSSFSFIFPAFLIILFSPLHLSYSNYVNCLCFHLHTSSLIHAPLRLSYFPFAILLSYLLFFCLIFPTLMLSYLIIFFSFFLIVIARLAGAVEYTNCTSTEGKTPHPHPTSVLHMTLNNLMVRFQ